MDLCKCAIKSIIVITILLCIASEVKCLKFDDDGAAEPNVQNVANITSGPAVETQGRQSGRNLFDFIGLGTGGSSSGSVDPFLRRMNEKCLNGELAECFKSQALNSFDEIFVRDSYEWVKVPYVCVSRSQLVFWIVSGYPSGMKLGKALIQDNKVAPLASPEHTM